jgi:hypothetical protein
VSGDRLICSVGDVARDVHDPVGVRIVVVVVDDLVRDVHAEDGEVVRIEDVDRPVTFQSWFVLLAGFALTV